MKKDPFSRVNFSEGIYGKPHVPITSEVLVCIQNMGDADQDLTGWHLRDQAHDDFEFPPFVLHAGEVGLGTYFGR